MKLRSITALTLALFMVVPCLTLGAAAAFSDVPHSAWYAQDVADVENYNIIEGTGHGKFSPNGNLTLAQAITMAARTHAYSYGKTVPASSGGAWYNGALEYAAQNGICAMGEFGTAYNNFCNRLTMALLFARVVPADTKQQINEVTSIPDVQDNPENQPIFDLYQLGILTGSDEYGTYHPYHYITRAETAAILNRVLNPEVRKHFILQEAPSVEALYQSALKQAKNYFYECIDLQEYPDEWLPDLGDFAYTIQDIDGSGFPELLIGFTNYPDRIFLAYTIEGNHAKCLCQGLIPIDAGYYNRHELRPNHVICHARGDEMDTIDEYYEVSNGSLRLIETTAVISNDELTDTSYWYSSTSNDPIYNRRAFKKVKPSFVQRIAAKYGEAYSIYFDHQIWF